MKPVSLTPGPCSWPQPGLLHASTSAVYTWYLPLFSGPTVPQRDRTLIRLPAQRKGDAPPTLCPGRVSVKVAQSPRKLTEGRMAPGVMGPLRRLEVPGTWMDTAPQTTGLRQGSQDPPSGTPTLGCVLFVWAQCPTGLPQLYRPAVLSLPECSSCGQSCSPGDVQYAQSTPPAHARPVFWARPLQRQSC